MDEMKDLGYANGWRKQPEIVKNCTHVKDIKQNRSGSVTEFSCKICGYRYKVDSGG